jgi:hypothetical protein
LHFGLGWSGCRFGQRRIHSRGKGTLLLPTDCF